VTELPRGTVTFLFTDIEGSTRLLKHLGERYGEILAQHQRIIRAAAEERGGREIDTQGDSFFFAFGRANAALGAAVVAQRALAEHGWPEGGEVRVRMGLHTGEPVVGDETYMGLGVHRAARIGAVAHGGQVVLSNATRELVEDEVGGVSVRELGSYRLKDIDRPERLFQLDIEGLQTEFPPLKAEKVAEPRQVRRRTVLIAMLAGVVAAAVAIPIFALGQGGSGGGITLEGNAVAAIDPQTNRVSDEVPVGSRPGQIAFGSGSLWVANLDDQTISRIDVATRRVSRTLPVVDTPTGLATSPGAVWVLGSTPTAPSVTVRRIDPQFDVVARQTRIGNVFPGGPGFVAARGESVWVAPSSGLLSRLDPKSSRVVQAIDPNASPTAVAVDHDAVWIPDAEANTVTRVDPTGLLTSIAVGHGPSGIAVGFGSVWVADTLDDAVVRIDPSTNAVTTTIAVGGGPAGVAVGAGSVWVANSRDGTVTRIDPAAGKAVKTIEVGGSPQAIAFADGQVWATVQPRTIGGLEAASPGGTARVSSENDVDFMDPALAFGPTSWQLLYATCAKLLNYPDKQPPAGSQLEPEVARSLPKRSADGKTYTFSIRTGFRFSPPSNEPVTAQTFRYAIERSLSPKLKGPGQGFLRDVVGAQAYMSGKAPHVAGVIARGNTLTIRLVAPAPDLITRIALPFFCAVPLDTPIDPKGVRIVPSAGPYSVRSYVPGQGIVLERNPSYTGSRPHHLERIELTVGVSTHKTLAQIEAGDADYAAGDVPAPDAPRLAARYGRESSAARKGEQQYFVNPVLGVNFLVLNTQRPLFRDARRRRGVNYAIDRRALAGINVIGGPGRPTDQYLPPGIPGFRDVHIYPFTPDVVRAKRLLAGGGRTAVLYTCNVPPCNQLAQVVKTDLAAVGITVEARALSFQSLFQRLATRGEPFDLAVIGWAADYPDPADFLNYVLGSGGGGAIPPFRDPVYTPKLAAAARLSGPRRYLAYGKLDAELARNAAPWAAYVNPTKNDFFSARMGCQVFHPIYGVDLAALCIRGQK